MTDDNGLADHPLIALGVPTATAAGGLATILNEINSFMTTGALVVGFLVSCALLRNHILKGRILARFDREEAAEEARLKAEHGLQKNP